MDRDNFLEASRVRRAWIPHRCKFLLAPLMHELSGRMASLVISLLWQWIFLIVANVSQHHFSSALPNLLHPQGWAARRFWNAENALKEWKCRRTRLKPCVYKHTLPAQYAGMLM